MMITPQGTLTMLEVEWSTCAGLSVPSWAPGSWGPEPEGQF